MSGIVTHGLSRNPANKARHTLLYGIWGNIKYRCHNPKSKDYPHYGGRGICVCEEWRKSYLSFHEWAMQNGYKEGLQIDRIDNDKGYSPDNCRWATPKQNSNNRGNKVMITALGLTLSVNEWSEKLGVRRDYLYNRFYAGKAEAYIEKVARRRRNE